MSFDETVLRRALFLPGTGEELNPFRNTRLLLAEPGAVRILCALALNLGKRLGIFRRQRGGGKIMAGGVDSVMRVLAESHARIAPPIGNVTDKVGLEIGPGDNLGLAEIFLAAGAREMHAVERLGTVQWSGELQRRIHAVHGSVPRKTPQLHVCRFEDCPIRNLDFIYSVDVMEHVQDLRLIFRAAFNTLKPGGMFVNAIDFRGHNAFNLESAPLNFLICNDWLYELMHSHIVTSNRVRIGQAVEALTAEGFEVKAVICTRQASLD